MRYLLTIILVVGLACSTVVAEDVKPGRYQFVPASNGAMWGYRFDTSNGRLWHVSGALDNLSEEILWQGVDGLDVPGRFSLIHGQDLILYLVDTATGSVWRVSGSWVSQIAGPVSD